MPISRGLGRYERNTGGSYGGLAKSWGLGEKNVPNFFSPTTSSIAIPSIATSAAPTTTVAVPAPPSPGPVMPAPSGLPGSGAVSAAEAVGYQPYQEGVQQQYPFKYGLPALMFPGLLQSQPAQPAPAPTPAKSTPLVLPSSVKIDEMSKGSRFKIEVTPEQAKVGTFAALLAAYWLFI